MSDYDYTKMGEHLNRRWYPGVLVGHDDGKIKDGNGVYPVLLDGAKSPYQCITAGFELGQEYLGYSVMIVYKKPLGRWVIVSLNGCPSKEKE